VSPPELLRVVLEECRRRGMRFERAWRKALNTLPRHLPGLSEDELIQWWMIWDQQADVWRACYERRSVEERAPLRLAA
jgi:hypothetical protein